MIAGVTLEQLHGSIGSKGKAARVAMTATAVGG
jgi:hypothetical protein